MSSSSDCFHGSTFGFIASADTEPAVLALDTCAMCHTLRVCVRNCPAASLSLVLLPPYGQLIVSSGRTVGKQLPASKKNSSRKNLRRQVPLLLKGRNKRKQLQLRK